VKRTLRSFATTLFQFGFSHLPTEEKKKIEIKETAAMVANNQTVIAFATANAEYGEFAGENFSNNLFTDLAPLLTLFGEQVTKQFMSQAVRSPVKSYICTVADSISITDGLG
jgi:hypothetical protein